MDLKLLSSQGYHFTGTEEIPVQGIQNRTGNFSMVLIFKSNLKQKKTHMYNILKTPTLTQHTHNVGTQQSLYNKYNINKRVTVLSLSLLPQAVMVCLMDDYYPVSPMPQFQSNCLYFSKIIELQVCCVQPLVLLRRVDSLACVTSVPIRRTFSALFPTKHGVVRCPTIPCFVEFFTLTPICARPEWGKSSSYGNGCYAGYRQLYTGY